MESNKERVMDKFTRKYIKTRSWYTSNSLLAEAKKEAESGTRDEKQILELNKTLYTLYQDSHDIAVKRGNKAKEENSFLEIQKLDIEIKEGKRILLIRERMHNWLSSLSGNEPIQTYDM